MTVLGKKVSISTGGATHVKVPGAGEVRLDLSQRETTSRTAAATALELTVSVNPLHLDVAEVTGTLTLAESTCETPPAHEPEQGQGQEQEQGQGRNRAEGRARGRVGRRGRPPRPRPPRPPTSRPRARPPRRTWRRPAAAPTPRISPPRRPHYCSRAVGSGPGPPPRLTGNPDPPAARRPEGPNVAADRLPTGRGHRPSRR